MISRGIGTRFFWKNFSRRAQLPSFLVRLIPLSYECICRGLRGSEPNARIEGRGGVFGGERRVGVYFWGQIQGRAYLDVHREVARKYLGDEEAI
jgi:hypothetical protein